MDAVVTLSVPLWTVQCPRNMHSLTSKLLNSPLQACTEFGIEGASGGRKGPKNPITNAFSYSSANFNPQIIALTAYFVLR